MSPTTSQSSTLLSSLKPCDIFVMIMSKPECTHFSYKTRTFLERENSANGPLASTTLNFIAIMTCISLWSKVSSKNSHSYQIKWRSSTLCPFVETCLEDLNSKINFSFLSSRSFFLQIKNSFRKSKQQLAQIMRRC